MNLIGATTKHFGNGEVRLLVTDDPKIVKAMQVKYKYDSEARQRPGCVVECCTGVEISVNGQKTLLQFGRPKKR